jgi:hypothetical protein
MRLKNEDGDQASMSRKNSNMNLKLATLEHRRGKPSALKQAMMMELLTGRTRPL